MPFVPGYAHDHKVKQFLAIEDIMLHEQNILLYTRIKEIYLQDLYYDEYDGIYWRVEYRKKCVRCHEFKRPAH